MDLINSILDNIDEAVIVTNPEGIVLLYNKVALEHSQDLLEKTLQLDTSITELLPNHRREITQSIFKNIRQHRRPQKTFAEYVSKNGSKYHLEINYVPVVTEGELTFIHIFVRDLTAQKIFERKLASQAANTNNLIEKAHAIVIGLDSRGYITAWNEHCSRITGFEKREVYAKRFTDVVLEKHQKEGFESILTHEVLSDPVGNFELPIITKTGKSVVLLLSCTLRTSPAGTTVGFVLVGQDVTELIHYRRSLEKIVDERTRELKMALKKEKDVVDMRSRFVSIASHEFRTPLSNIEYETSALKKIGGKIGLDELTVKLNKIEKQIQHMNRLLDDVLTYNKNEVGKIQLILSNLNIRDFIQKVAEEVGQSTKHTHRINLEIGTLPTNLYTDEKLLRNILTNILTNAIKFSPGKETIRFIVQTLGNQLVFVIIDHGIGISPDERDKVFEPFLRGSNANSIQGTGLGLSIVKKAVELLHGTLQFESRIGEGSTFTVSIPLDITTKYHVTSC
ncbi:MAG TPA: PAS domain-containing sensor histidine kinase [Cyclobacteriaceae bacterium]|mgnify:CR=1 FL=1|nr:PAS domain-containing sensor histidine kinase [Cyclobacteriaceae bacterium]HRJ82986.1 PAS domain-containing sensor histidine kinase [Cyclobacteriaceae bacterium]